MNKVCFALEICIYMFITVQHSSMQRPIHSSFGWGKNQCRRVEIWVDGWGAGNKMKQQKRSSKTIDIVNVCYALKVSRNGVTCVFVVHFRSSDTFESL